MAAHRAARPPPPQAEFEAMTTLVAALHPFAGTACSWRSARFIPAPENASTTSPIRPQAGARPYWQGPVRYHQRLSALANLPKPSPADATAPSNPHRRPKARRCPAGSFFGSFRTPAATLRRLLALGRHPKPLPIADLHSVPVRPCQGSGPGSRPAAISVKRPMGKAAMAGSKTCTEAPVSGPAKRIGMASP